MNTTSCFVPAQILLPGEQIPLEQWGCIACDQFTSDPGYWARAEAAAGDSPSTLRLILPEVFFRNCALLIGGLILLWCAILIGTDLWLGRRRR